MDYKVMIWDNDGTIMGSRDPNDTGNRTRVILPGVCKTMQQAPYNCIISGCKTPQNELRNFDTEKIIVRFTALMQELPVSIVLFSPAIGGVECYVMIKKSDGTIELRKAHEDPRYYVYIGHFKKPGIGMFVVLHDILQEELKMQCNKDSIIMVGDSWHDKVAAHDFGIDFMEADIIHNSKENR